MPARLGTQNASGEENLYREVGTGTQGIKHNAHIQCAVYSLGATTYIFPRKFIRFLVGTIFLLSAKKNIHQFFLAPNKCVHFQSTCIWIFKTEPLEANYGSVHSSFASNQELCFLWELFIPDVFWKVAQIP